MKVKTASPISPMDVDPSAATSCGPAITEDSTMDTSCSS